MLRILFALYLPLMLAPIPAGAAAKKSPRKVASAEKPKAEPKLADNYNTDLSYTLEINVKSVPSSKKK